MNSTTNEERCEAAANLRKIHLGGANKDLIELMLSDAVGAWHENGISWDYITDRLADLIDPTCRIVSGDADNHMPHCNLCGTGNFDLLPKYCKGCGARIVYNGNVS